MGASTGTAQAAIREFVRRGDRLAWGQGAGEPRLLVAALEAELHRVNPIEIFLGIDLSGTGVRLSSRGVKVTSYGAFGRARGMDGLNIIPCNYSALPNLIRSGALSIDVVLLQVSPEVDGRYCYGLSCDYLKAAIESARVVIAEVNHNHPRINGDAWIDEEKISVVAESAYSVLDYEDAPPSEADTAIGNLVAEVVPPDACLQLGIGRLCNAVSESLRHRADITVHTGLASDWVMAIGSSARHSAKPRVVASTVMGTQALYRYVHDNPSISIRAAEHIYAPAVIAGIQRFVAVNTALEVDLLGNVSAESYAETGPVGGVGGHQDFMHGAAASRKGLAVVALPSTAKRGRASRITARLSGLVSTTKSDVDIVVTEYGRVDIRGLSLSQRRAAIASLAAPQWRTSLMEESAGR